MGLFNSFNKTMKKAYSVLNPEARDAIFPKGEDEFLYVTTLLKNNLKGRDISDLIGKYASIKTFAALEKGNYYYIADYSKRKMPNYSDDEVYTVIAIAMSTMLPNLSFNPMPIYAMDKCKNSVVSELDTILKIKNHPEIFDTKDDDNVGTGDNPILLPGLSGVKKYFESLVTKDGKEVSYKRSACFYLTDKATGINYALDQYDVYIKDTHEKICSIFINEYGTDLCKFCPKGFKFKKD